MVVRGGQGIAKIEVSEQSSKIMERVVIFLPPLNAAGACAGILVRFEPHPCFKIYSKYTL